MFKAFLIDQVAHNRVALSQGVVVVGVWWLVRQFWQLARYSPLRIRRYGIYALLLSPLLSLVVFRPTMREIFGCMTLLRRYRIQMP